MLTGMYFTPHRVRIHNSHNNIHMHAANKRVDEDGLLKCFHAQHF